MERSDTLDIGIVDEPSIPKSSPISRCRSSDSLSCMYLRYRMWMPELKFVIFLALSFNSCTGATEHLYHRRKSRPMHNNVPDRLDNFRGSLVNQRPANLSKHEVIETSSITRNRKLYHLFIFIKNFSFRYNFAEIKLFAPM